MQINAHDGHRVIFVNILIDCFPSKALVIAEQLFIKSKDAAYYNPKLSTMGQRPSVPVQHLDSDTVQPPQNQKAMA